MAFDIEGARKAGYSSAEIADFLSGKANFDASAARKAGYSDDEIISHLGAELKPEEPSGGSVMDRVDPGSIAPANNNTGIRFDDNGYSSVDTRAMDIAARNVVAPQSGIPVDGMAATSRFIQGSTSPRISDQNAVTRKPEQMQAAAVDAISRADAKARAEIARASAERAALRQSTAEDSPYGATAISGLSRIGSNIADIPQFMNDAIKFTVINPVLHAAGQEGMRDTDRFAIAKDLEQAANEFSPEVKSIEDVDLTDPADLGRWAGINALQQAPQIALGSAAAFIPKLRNSYLGLMGAMTAAGEHQRNLGEGVNFDTSMVDAATKGAFEVIGESLGFNVYDKLGGAISKMTLGQRATFAHEMTKRAMVGAGALAGQMASGAVEEGITQVGQNASSKYVLNDGKTKITDGLLNSMAVGALIEGPTSVALAAKAATAPMNAAPTKSPEQTAAEVLQSGSVDEAIDKLSQAVGDDALDAASLVDEPQAQRPFGLLSQGPTGFGQVNELADLAAQERADVEARRNAIAAEQQAANALRLSSELETTDARVAGATEAETRQSRLAALDSIYANPDERTPGMSFLSYLEANHPNNPVPTPEEKAVIAKREQAYQAFKAMPEEQSVDFGIPEKSAQPTAERSNAQKFAQVDEYLANGYRPAAGGKKLVNGKGKTLFLNVAQREYLNSLPQAATGTAATSPEVGQPAAPIQAPSAQQPQEVGAPVQTAAQPIQSNEFTNSLSRTASWVIRNKDTGEVIMETFDKAKVDALNTEKYDAVPILQHLQSLNTPAISAAVPANNVETAPVFGTNSAGKITLRGVPMEQIKAVRDKLGAKGWIIGKDSAVFPGGTKLDELKRAFGVPDEKPLPKPRRTQRASSDLLQRIKQLGGIDATAVLDITGEARAPGGWKFAFRKGGTSLDDLATMLADEGFNIDTSAVDGGVQQVRDMIRAHINGERNFKAAALEAQAEAMAGERVANDRIAYAESLGIKWQNLTEAQLDDAIYLAEDDLRMAAIAEQEVISDAGMADAELLADQIEDGQDIPFGNDVQTDDAALAAFLGEQHGENDQRNRGNSPAASGERAQEDTERGAQAGGAAQGGFALESHTNAEVLKREAAKAKAEEESNKEPPAKNVTTDQADLFNTQGALFNSNREQPTNPETSSAQAGNVNQDDVVFEEGKGQLGRGKWIARIGETSGNLMPSKEEAEKSLREILATQAQFSAQSEKVAEAQLAVANKLKSGENPSFSEWKSAFPQLRDGDTYLRQPEISPFLIEHFGLKRNAIKSGIGNAAGDVTSDMGAKYPVVYFGRLADALVQLPPAQRPSELRRVAERQAEDPVMQRQEAAFKRAEAIGSAASELVGQYENGDIEIDDFERGLDALEPVAKQSAIAAIKADTELSKSDKLNTIRALNSGDIAPEDVRDVVGKPAEQPRDNAVVNIPLAKRGDIDAQLDKYKREQAALAKTKAKESAQQTREAKALAKTLLGEYQDVILAKHGDKFGKKELAEQLDQWAKWEPKKLIDFIEKFRAEQSGSGAVAQEKVDYSAETYTVAVHEDVMERIAEGNITADEFKAAFEALTKNRAGIIGELNAMTKPQLFKRSPGLEYRYKNEKKADVIDAAYRGMLDDFVLSDSISYSMGQKYEDVIRGYVERTTDEKLADYAEQVRKNREERAARRAEALAGMDNPQTLDDYKRLMSAKAAEIGPEATFRQAFMALTPEQRAQYDALAAEQTRGDRMARADQQKTDVRVAAHTTTGDVIETKHTKTGEPLFVVKAAERVERDVYNHWNATAKRLGGWYSSYRGNGAVPGFQFKTRENADAFLAFLGGNVEQAKEVVQARRDAYADDRSQTAVERLTEMAAALDERADEILGQERKVNTARRARFAASAEASANADKALAQTMRNIADGIQNGTAKLLDRVRQKTQVEMLNGIVTTAQNDMLREKYPTYAEQERHKGEKPTPEVADYVTFPTYTAFRSDLASLGRALLETEGAKAIGQRLMKVADDVTDAYLEFAKENLHKVSAFKMKDGGMAVFPSKAAAEQSIAASGYHGAAIVLPFKRGQNMIILSPSEAIKRGIWEGDNDKRITLSPDFGAEIVEKLGKTSSSGMMNVRNAYSRAPWQFENAYDKRKRLAAMGIETPAELRAAVREFIGLRQAAKAPDKVKELERAMIGRRNDGLDFFPTPAAVADEMIEAAGIEEGMSILEPSAGMGHIADRIRAAGAEPDVVELSGDRRELLEAKGYSIVGHDFMDINPRGFTYGDTFRAPDGKEGIMRGAGGMGSGRVRLVDENGDMLGYYFRDELQEVRKNGHNSGYDRILMNPPFGDRRDALHVQHAYELLRPGGRMVAIVGEGVFFGNDAKAQGFRDWLESVGGTEEKLEQGTFLDPSLPVNTGVSARMVVIDKDAAKFSRGAPISNPHTTESAQEAILSAHTGKIKGAIKAMFDAGKARSITANQAAAIIGEDALYSVSGYNVPDELIKELGEIHPDVDAFLSIKGDQITLSELQMPKDIRGQGLGSRFMDILTAYADRNGMTIALTAAGDFGGSRAGQERFYKRFDFVENKGRNKDYRIGENMLRRPKDIRYSNDGRAVAFFNPADGVTYFIADHLSKDASAQGLRGLTAHEIGVHALHLGRDSKEFQSILKQLELLRKSGNKAVVEAFGRVPEGTPEWHVQEEALAYLVQKSPDLPISKRIIAWFRNALRELGKRLPVLQRAKFMEWANSLTESDIVFMAQEAMARWKPEQISTAESAGVLASREMQPAESFARMVLEELATSDELFAYEKTSAKTIDGAILDVVPNAEFMGDMTREDERAESHADRRYGFKTGNGLPFYVYERDTGEVWIDVSRLETGSGGGAIYAAVGNYAYNTGKKFIGDPFGLSAEAVIRRTHHMLSSALRFGTTRHLEAARQQEWGNPENGVEPLDWTGTDVDKVEAMIQTIVATTENLYPAIKEYRYDFDKEIYVKQGRDGIPVDGATISARAGSSRKAGAASVGSNPAERYGLGEKTARRVVLLKSLLDAAGGKVGADRGAILERILRWSDSTVPQNVQWLFSRRAGSDDDTGDRAGGAQPPSQRPLDLQGGQSGNSASWDSPEPSKLDDIIYTLQDKHIDMKRVVQAVKDAGGALLEKFNPYLAEELFHGRAAKRTQDFVNTELKPLLADMRLRGISLADLDQYLHARHAKEANALIAERDPSMPDGGSGMTNADADEYMDGLNEAKRKRLEAAAAKVDSIISKTRDLYVSYGLISRDQADSWAEMFQHYVPLMREDHDGGMGMGQGFSIKGKEAKHRTGSTAKVVDILANIALQREKAITRGEKNRVAVALAGLVKLNPNTDFWTFGKPPVERVLNEKTGLVEERVDPTFKSRQNVVIAKIKDSNGQVHERAVIFNEHNDRAVRMAEAIKNMDHIQLGGVMGVSAIITRWFASVNTQYNPVFGIVNIARDVQGMALNLSSTPLAEHRADVLKQIPSALKGIYQDSRSEREGKAGTSKWAQLWEELQDEGGMTGYRDLYRNSADRADAIEHEIDPTRWHNSVLGKIFTANGTLKVPLKIAQNRAGWLFDWLSDYNQTLEGATRLATYKVARDNGMTKQQAASLAKNITVNFNRKGQIGQQAGALYAFFNAAMQGSARIAQTMLTYENGKVGLTKAGKAIVYGGMTLGAMQAIALAAAGFGDDEPPEFVRERSLILPIGGKKYLTLPMPLGFHVFPNLGRIQTEWALDGFKNTGRRMTDMVGIFLEAFNPMGSAGMSLQTVMPTAIDPMVALAENKDWTGKPIYKEDFNSMKPTPGFERNKDTATAWSKGIAEGLNYLSGGTAYTPGAISPTADQIDYLIGQVTGGVGRELGKLAQTGEATVTGEALAPHKVPLLGRFYGNAENQSSQGNAYYSNLKRIYEVEAEIKGRREDGIPTDEYKAENPEWRLIARAKYADNIIHKLKKQKRELMERGAEREKIRAIEDRITNEMRRLNDAVMVLEEKAAA